MNDEIKSYGNFDVIISNPPYVLESDKNQMHQNVLEFEPASALFVDDQKALLFYEKILDFARLNLKNKGLVYFEIHEEKEMEMELLLKTRGYDFINFKKDFRNKTRFVKAIKV